MAGSLGILGGTFDPVHLGHLAMAQAVAEQLGLEQVLFLPAAVAPHKQGLRCAPAPARYEMVRLAIAGHPLFALSDIELRRSGVSYTVDSLRQLRSLYPGRQLYFIIGADSLSQLPTWHCIQEQLQLAVFVAAGRPGYQEELDGLGPLLAAARAGRILTLATPAYDISSTQIRQAVARGESLAGLVPAAVESYIYRTGLYRGE